MRKIPTADGKETNIFELPETSERLFRKFAVSSDDEGKAFYNIYNPNLRDEAYARGLNEIKRQIEFNCSLAYGTLSNPQNVDKTAEEIKASKQRSYTAVNDMQTSLESVLKDYIYACDIMTTVCHSQSVDENGTFGDGTEKAVNGLLKKWGYKPNGIAGDNFIKKLTAEIRKKI